MSLNFADLIVLGDDISGIAAGGLLAKRGFNVMVLDRVSSSQTLSLPGLQSRSFQSFVNKVGILDARVRALKPNPISFQVILPDHRIDITADQDHLLAEMEREFPRQLDWTRQLLDEVEAAHEEEARPLMNFLPWLNWREKRRFLKLKKNYEWPRWTDAIEDLPIPMQSFLKAWVLFLAGNPTNFAEALQPFSLLAAENRSTTTVKGGWRELKRLFFDKIEYYGGTVIAEASSNYLYETESSLVKGVAFDGYHFATRCRYLIGNAPLPEQLAHIPKSFRTRRYCRQLSRTPIAQKYTIRFLTHSDVLPQPMCQDVVCIQDPAAPLIDTNYFQIHVLKVSQPPAPDEDTILEVSYYLPHQREESLSPELVDEFERRHEIIEQALRDLLPFSQGRLRRIYPLPGNGQDELFDSNVPDYTPFLQLGRREARYPPSFSFPSLTTPYSNLFTLGPDQLGWLGVPGRMQSAIKTVDCIWDMETKQKKI